jgi:hypothetical protein
LKQQTTAENGERMTDRVVAARRRNGGRYKRNGSKGVTEKLQFTIVVYYFISLKCKYIKFKNKLKLYYKALLGYIMSQVGPNLKFWMGYIQG